jgi:integrase/recombinase XerD
MSLTTVALNSTELRNLLTVTRERDHRAYVLFLIAVCHGLRVTEVINLRRRDFNLTGENIYLTVNRLKGSEKTTQRLNLSAEALFNERSVVREYIEDLGRDDLLFPTADGDLMTRQTVSRLIEKFGALADIPQHKRFIHVLKHTTGTSMRLAGFDLRVIQSALGHKNLASTAAYLRVSSEEVDDAREQAFGTAVGK